MASVGAVRSISVLAVLLGLAPRASADPAVLLASRWPAVPEGHGLSLEDQITDHLTQLGNELGRHLDLLSHAMFRLEVDGRHRHAHVRVGGGEAELLTLQLDGDIQFEDINAHVHARLDLALHGHAVHLELPAFDMATAEYRGDLGVEVRLPLLVRTF
jgi:hypothetical protein